MKAAAATETELGRLEVHRADARKILGRIAERTFATLESEGVIVPTRRGRGGRKSVYALDTIVPAYLGHVSGSRPANDRDARARRDLALAELNELRVAKERGDLLPRPTIVLQGQAYTKAWAAMIRGVSRRARQVGIVADAVQETALAALCREILTEIAEWRTLADVQAVIHEEEPPAPIETDDGDQGDDEAAAS